MPQLFKGNYVKVKHLRLQFMEESYLAIVEAGTTSFMVCIFSEKKCSRCSRTITSFTTHFTCMEHSIVGLNKSWRAPQRLWMQRYVWKWSISTGPNLKFSLKLTLVSFNNNYLITRNQWRIQGSQRWAPIPERRSNLFITSNDRPFGCPIICTDTNSQCYFVNKHLNNAWYIKGHWPTGRPYLATIASNDLANFPGKLHENEEFLGQRGMRPSRTPRSANGNVGSLLMRREKLSLWRCSHTGWKQLFSGILVS